MFNLLIISGLLTGCASSPIDEAVFNEEFEATTEDLAVATPISLPVTVEDGFAGHVEAVAYKVTEEGITIGRILSRRTVEEGSADLPLPANAPRRDFTSNPNELITYAIVLRDMDYKIRGIADAKLVYSRVRSEGVRMGWSLAAPSDVSEYSFEDFTQGVELSSNLVGADKLTFNVVSTVESSESQQFGVVTITDQLYSFWNTGITPGMEVTLDEYPPMTAFAAGIEGLSAAQMVGVAYEDSNGDGGYTDGETIDGFICDNDALLQPTFIQTPSTVDVALTMQNIGIKAGWSFITNGSGGPEVMPADYGTAHLVAVCGEAAP